MFRFSIDGAWYALVATEVLYTINEIELPPGKTIDDATITWYKDGQVVHQYDWETQEELKLYDVGYPAAGEYYATAEIDGLFARSNVINLEIGTQMRPIILNVQTRSRVEADVGEVVQFAPRCATIPPYAHRNCWWTKDGVKIGIDEYISIPVDDSAYGEYILHSEAFSPGGYIPAEQVHPLRIVPKGSIDGMCPIIYLHDLNPKTLGGGRDRGYIWVGYWVIDEIFDAVIEGFDWMADPSNNRFKYKCEIAKLAEGFNQYPDLEIQESRHGYILTKRDLQ